MEKQKLNRKSSIIERWRNDVYPVGYELFFPTQIEDLTWRTDGFEGTLLPASYAFQQVSRPYGPFQATDREHPDSRVTIDSAIGSGPVAFLTEKILPELHVHGYSVPPLEGPPSEPLKFAGLHREFAQLESDLDFQRFANIHGLLRRYIWMVRRSESTEPLLAESCREWQIESLQMRGLLEVWDAYRTGESDVANWERLIDIRDRWARFARAYYRYPDDLSRDYIRVLDPDEWRSHESKYSACARVMLKHTIALQLGINMKPNIDIGPGSQLTLRPSNLIGVMYVLFMQELLGRADPMIRCRGCGRWFVSRHASRVFCSDACKMKAYRQNKKGDAK